MPRNTYRGPETDYVSRVMPKREPASADTNLIDCHEACQYPHFAVAYLNNLGTIHRYRRYANMTVAAKDRTPAVSLSDNRSPGRIPNCL